MKIQLTTPNPNIMPMSDIPFGKFAVIVDTAYNGSIVFRLPSHVRRGHDTAEFLMLINGKAAFDSFRATRPILVRVLDEGETFAVTV